MLTKRVEITEVKDAGSQYRGKLYNATLRLTITDDAGPGFVKDFRVQYKEGDDLSVDERLARIVKSVVPEMQAAINAYIKERTIIDLPKVATMISEIESRLEA